MPPDAGAAGLALSLRLTSARHASAEVLGPIALDLAPRETVAVCGPSGIGKTTLLRVIAGLHRDWEGRMDRPGRLAMVFQDPVLLPWRTAAQNLTIAIGCTGAEAEAHLASVGLAGLGARFPGALSLGQQRRLSLARAFAVRPDLLLMDEAFASLDPATADQMMALFSRLAAETGVATLMVTHSAAEAARLASRTLTLGGRPARFADAA